jgi:hypothetical protein
VKGRIFCVPPSTAGDERAAGFQGGEADRVHAEILEAMKRMQQQRDEFWR